MFRWLKYIAFLPSLQQYIAHLLYLIKINYAFLRRNVDDCILKVQMQQRTVIGVKLHITDELTCLLLCRHRRKSVCGTN